MVKSSIKAQTLLENANFCYGQSMKGTLRYGDLVVYEKIEFSQLKIGDVLAFIPKNRRDNKGVVHRIIARTESEITTQGDFNLAPDDYITRADDEFYLVAAINRNGKIIPLAQGSAGMRKFRRNQFVRKLYQLRGIMIKLISKATPLSFFAPKIEELQVREFTKNKKFLYFKKRKVAVYNFRENNYIPLSYWKLFYNSKMLSNCKDDYEEN